MRNSNTSVFNDDIISDKTNKCQKLVHLFQINGMLIVEFDAGIRCVVKTDSVYFRSKRNETLLIILYLNSFHKITEIGIENYFFQGFL